MSTANQSQLAAPYSSWTMFEATLERMRQDGVPARIDRSFLHSASGSARAQLTGTLKAFGLIDDEYRPSTTLDEMAKHPERRPAIMRGLAEAFYKPILALDANATQGQLEEAFRSEYGIQGSTVKKAVSFFLQVARFSGIEVSPMFQTTRTPSAGTSARRKRSTRPGATTPVPAAPSDPMSELRTKYVESLLEKFAQSDGEVDADLADRIERLVGFQTPAGSES